MARRSRFEIYFDILKVIGKGTDRPTRIMYQTNLSWIVLQEMFESLTSGGFIGERPEKSGVRYYLTDKGRNALSYHLKSIDGLAEVKMNAPLLTR